MLIILGAFVLHWYLSLFCQTFFLHRYAAHGQFTMSRGWEKFFYVFTFLSQGSSYLSPFAYGSMHRMHHAYADQEQDPHSPKFSRNLFVMMWDTKNIYNDIFRGVRILDERFTKGVPQWKSFDTFADYLPVRLSWVVIYTAFYIAFVPAGAWYLYLLLPIHFAMGPVHGAVINWFAHKIGYRNYEVEDTSVNMWPIELIMMGEGLHNNHHTHGYRANFAVKWYEFDPTYPFIRLFDALGIIKLKRMSRSLMSMKEAENAIVAA